MADERRDDPLFEEDFGEESEVDFDAEFERTFDAEFDAVLDPRFDPTADLLRDPALGAALRGLEAVSAPEPDWERMHASIRATAAQHLARRQLTAHWWQHAAGWAARAIPVGLAASIALFIGLRALGPGGPTPDRATAPASALETMLAVLFDEAQESSIPADGEELLRAAIAFED
jgi:hypothetical protein